MKSNSLLLLRRPIYVVTQWHTLGLSSLCLVMISFNVFFYFSFIQTVKTSKSVDFYLNMADMVLFDIISIHLIKLEFSFACFEFSIYYHHLPFRFSSRKAFTVGFEKYKGYPWSTGNDGLLALQNTLRLWLIQEQQPQKTAYFNSFIVCVSLSFCIIM